MRLRRAILGFGAIPLLAGISATASWGTESPPAEATQVVPSEGGKPLDDASAELASWALAEEFGVSIDQARLQMARQPAIFALSEALQKEAGDAWAGSWIDQANGGELVAQVTDAKALASDVVDSAELPVRVEVVANSLAALNDDNDAVLGLLDEATEAQPYVDLKLNRVVLRYSSDAALRAQGQEVAEGDTRARVSAIADQFETVDVLETPYVQRSLAGCSLFNGACDPQIRGGMEFHVGGRLCTTGFNVRSTSDLKPYVLTAAHCVTDAPALPWSTVWASFYKGGSNVLVGPTHNLIPKVAGFDDEAIMSITSNAAWGVPATTRVLIQSSGGTRPTVTDAAYTITAVGTVANVPADGYLCMTGAVTDTGCHTFIGTSNFFGILSVRAADGENVCAGDSGGPIFAAHRGFGILSDGSITANRTYTTLTNGTVSFPCVVDLGPDPTIRYMSLTRAMAQLGVQLSP